MAQQPDDVSKLIPMLVLYKLIHERDERLKSRDAKLEEIKEQTKDKALLEELDEKQLEIEDELLAQVQRPKAMQKFLKNILLLENLMNAFYTPQLQKEQKDARAAYAPAIADKEAGKKAKLQYDADTFETIYNNAKAQEKIFGQFCKKLTKVLAAEGLKLKYPAKPNVKKAPRSFYKAYFWYTGDKSHNKLSDLLRTSLVFTSFEDVYKAYTIITRHCKVLRVKDRFNAKSVPFGYRDCLLNIRCPGKKSKMNGMTPLICEVQLHHTCFYDNKKDSHKVYKLARLFEAKPDGKKVKAKINFARASAKKYYGKAVGDKVYKKDMNLAADADDDDDEDEALLANLNYAREQIEDGRDIQDLIAEFMETREQDDDYSDEDYYSSDSDYEGSDDEYSEESDFEDESWGDYDDEKDDYSDEEDGGGQYKINRRPADDHSDDDGGDYGDGGDYDDGAEDDYGDEDDY